MTGDVQEGNFRAGYVTLLGRPNVGKSTLLNRLVEQKISITSRKPQTTRCQITGIRSGQDYQAVFVDTPGIQHDYNTPVHRLMSAEAKNSLDFVDLVIFVIEALKWTPADEKILKLIEASRLPVVVVINKIDKLRNMAELLPFIARLESLRQYEVVPIAAINGRNLADLEQTVRRLLPVGERFYPDDQLTTHNRRFFAAEFIREKLINRLGDELPYRVSVTIEEFTDEGHLARIKAVIWVEGKSKKNIVIGRQGEVLKAVGEAARRDLEELFGEKVFLQTWVKVRKNWTQSVDALQELVVSGPREG